MNVRRYRPEDASSLAALYRRSVEALGPRDYSAEQVTAWATLCPTPERLQILNADGRVILVAVDKANQPLAFADLKADGHIQFFYCAPEACGTGVAAKLYDALERRARAQGISRLYAEASVAARRFFLKRGFAATARRGFTIGGVPIHNYAVEKRLVPGRAEHV